LLYRPLSTKTVPTGQLVAPDTSLS